MTEIYEGPLASDLKPISEMTDADMEQFKARYDFFMWVYNRIWVVLDEKAVNRAIEVICASLGYQPFKIGKHHYCYKPDPENLQ